MIPMHPQACPGQPDRLRWVVPGGIRPLANRGSGLPEPLTSLIDDGTLADVVFDATGVLARLGPGHCWAVDGPRVRTALHAALAQVARRGSDSAPATPDRGREDPTDDASLRVVAQRLVEGAAGEFVRSHGGTLELIGVRDGVVRVRLGGACDGCPAARVTTQGRLEAELRRRCPGLREVVAEGRRPRLYPLWV